MAERYSKIFKYKENTYTEGSPVIISAGALLSDNVTNNVIAQLKFQSVSQKNIKALTVGIMQLDTAERVLGEEIKHQYLDLSVNIGEMFGSKVAIPLTDNSTRCFSARVIEVVFSDNSVWESDNTAIWEKLILPKRQIDDAELIKQFKIKHGFEYKNHFEKQKDLWFCFCGAVNKDERCHICGSELSKLEEFDVAILKTECDKRLIEEKEERERRQEEFRIKQLKEKEEAEIRIKKIKKIVAICTPILCAVITLILVLNNVIIPYCENESKYKEAISIMDSGKYEEAISSFSKLDGFKDSETKIEDCKKAIKENKYNKALLLLKSKKTDEAYSILEELGDYKDSRKLVAEIMSTTFNEIRSNLKVGDKIMLGTYEQDGNNSNGKEDVEWIVLKTKDKKALLISQYALDCQPYNATHTQVTWETCTLRKWLNNEFFNTIFTATEKSLILTETVSVGPYYEENPGNDTKDKVYLLNWNDFEESDYEDDSIYNKVEEALDCCEPTKYAINQGVALNDDSKTCWWWMLYPCGDYNYANGVSYYGDTCEPFYPVDTRVFAVRPVIWIDTNQLK